MTRIKISQLHQKENELFLELSEYESYMIVGGINPQPLPPAFIARQPEIKLALAGANKTHTNAPG